MKCHKCGSNNLIAEKTINWTPVTDISFHFRTRCKSCGSYKFWSRSLMPEEIRDSGWVFSLATKKRIAGGLISKDLLVSRLEEMGMEMDEESVVSTPLFSREVDGATQKPTTA